MNVLAEKFKEVLKTIVPVVLLVVVLCLTLVEVETDIFVSFLVSSAMLLAGLSVFLLGIDLAMDPIGEHMSLEIATSRTPFKIAVLSFLLGFLVTVAEPDLLILGSQIEAASEGGLDATVIVYIVSVGVGIMISLGVFRILTDKPLNLFMAISYALFFTLALFVSEEFLAMSFDSSGATTGALTTPFVLAISLGLANIKGGKNAEGNSFGLVGIMSAGPILAIMLMSIITGQKDIQGGADNFASAEGVLGPIAEMLPAVFRDSLIALLPITILFFVYNFARFKLAKDKLSTIIKGLILTVIGLTLFLTAANSGFMDMGRIIGIQIAETNKWLLVGIGFLIGLIVVLVEPAVHVLGEQIEEVTSGHIPVKLIRITLSLAVGIAIALSMVRITVPEVKLWYFLLPGFAIAILLSFRVDPIFVGIAYDAGGVASGPMAATFVLAFAQGAAMRIDTANVLVDGFGVIAMVAMSPVLAIMILGTAFNHRRTEEPEVEEDLTVVPLLEKENSLEHACIMVVVKRGFAEEVVDLARESGAAGATILRGRGTDVKRKVVLPIVNIELQPEKEIVLLITETHICEQIADNLLHERKLAKEGKVEVFVSPTLATL